MDWFSSIMELKWCFKMLFLCSFEGYVVNVRFNSIQSPESMNRLLGVLDIPNSLKRKRVNDLDFSYKVQKIDITVSSK